MTSSYRGYRDNGPFLFAVIALLLCLLSVFVLEAGASTPRIILPEPEPVETAEQLEPTPEPDPTEMLQLGIAIYREAGGDAVCDQCRYRVGDVVLNRTADHRFPDTIEQVLTQRGQYGTMYWEGVAWPDRAYLPEERHAVERALDTAYDLLAGNHSDLYEQGYIYQSEFPDLGNHATQCCGIYYAKG